MYYVKKQAAVEESPPKQATRSYARKRIRASQNIKKRKPSLAGNETETMKR